MHLWKYRGLIYSIFLGFLTPQIYILLLDLVASFIEIPFSGYLIGNYQLDVRMTISVVMFSLDTLLAILLSIIFAYPLGRIGHGNVFWKILFYLFAFYLSLIIQEQDANFLNVLITMLFIPELSIYAILNCLAIYFGNKDALRQRIEENK